MNSQIKAVIFDLDGLLIDSEPLWSQVDYEMFDERGFKPTEALFRKRLGTGNKRTVEIYKEEFNFKESVEELASEREKRFFKKLDQKIPPMSGASDLVKSFAKKNLKLAIATSGPHKNRMGRILNELGISDCISAIVTGEEIKRLKPAPDIFLAAAGKLDIEPEHCLVFEDAPSGVVSAKAAGMIAYGVNRDEITRKQLKEAGADEVYASLSEIEV